MRRSRTQEATEHRLQPHPLPRIPAARAASGARRLREGPGLNAFDHPPAECGDEHIHCLRDGGCTNRARPTSGISDSSGMRRGATVECQRRPSRQKGAIERSVNPMASSVTAVRK